MRAADEALRQLLVAERERVGVGAGVIRVAASAIWVGGTFALALTVEPRWLPIVAWQAAYCATAVAVLLAAWSWPAIRRHIYLAVPFIDVPLTTATVLSGTRAMTAGLDPAAAAHGVVDPRFRARRNVLRDDHRRTPHR